MCDAMLAYGCQRPAACAYLENQLDSFPYGTHWRTEIFPQEVHDQDKLELILIIGSNSSEDLTT
jgi:hypothetical protein